MELEFRAWYKGPDYEVDEIDDYSKPRMIFDIQNLYDGMGIGNQSAPGVNTFGHAIEDEQYEVMQYTNVTDNNGDKVFVGDIIGPVMDCCNGDNCEIVFYDGCFCAKYKDRHRPINKLTSVAAWGGVDDKHHYDFTIKGNIYENPELLTWKN